MWSVNNHEALTMTEGKLNEIWPSVHTERHTGKTAFIQNGSRIVTSVYISLLLM